MVETTSISTSIVIGNKINNNRPQRQLNILRFSFLFSTYRRKTVGEQRCLDTDNVTHPSRWYGREETNAIFSRRVHGEKCLISVVDSNWKHPTESVYRVGVVSENSELSRFNTTAPAPENRQRPWPWAKLAL